MKPSCRSILLHLSLLILAPLLFGAEEGFASWYGGKFHGRLTASGEVFDTYKHTAAHKTLPFGARVQVTNLENGKSTVVRINDRGPFVEGRIIDLSLAAAQEIGLAGAGVATVRIELLEGGPPLAEAAEERFLIQVGAYRDPRNAERIEQTLKAQALSPVLEVSSAGIHRVVLKDLPEKDLDGMLSRLKELGFSGPLVRRQR